MSPRSLAFVAGLFTLFCASGCGESGKKPEILPLVPAGGTLLVDGKPLDGVVLTFTPEGSRKISRGGMGKTDASGAFTVTDLDQNKPGLPAGKYTVTYSRMRLPDGSAAPVPQPGTPPDPGNIQVETLPSHLTTPNPSAPVTQVEIPKDGNTKLDLKISTKM